MEGDWQTEKDDEGFADGESPDDETMETNLAAEGDDELLNGRATVYYAIPVSPTLEEQGKDFTKDEVEEMMKSEPYQKKISTCHLCKQCWFDGKITPACPECGGFTLQRPCPVCGGQCDQIWRRNIKTSHSFHKAQWEGVCGLPVEMQQVFMLRNPSDSSEQSLSAGMQDLSTR